METRFSFAGCVSPSMLTLGFSHRIIFLSNYQSRSLPELSPPHIKMWTSRTSRRLSSYAIGTGRITTRHGHAEVVTTLIPNPIRGHFLTRFLAMTMRCYVGRAYSGDSRLLMDLEVFFWMIALRYPVKPCQSLVKG
jgi:hypothetical protein